ncbi:SigE family RNA polymerase sigma factor [Plantactinospora endophytica]|uniref:DNA-directed RNA polymerase sigma-70 factor n=1 Tax=Plantactinospora endophytica TaxID=673535 RepID=A0ABQ4E6B8_9ACTN|nr:SigE family RNA polymerase sigma factor [Plantactinospora endophytica]GIG90230.1 DNA-directed RNA polymerase sigma-70 factor [Plantactinospora endophytica]
MPEPESFDDFVRACSHRLYRVGCLLTGGNRAQAEDLVAEALARVYLAWPRVRSGDAFGYARRTIVNLHTDWWRGLRHRREVLTDEMPDVPGGTDQGGQVVRRDSVVRSLRRLTRRERAVVVLRYFLDLTEQDTAAELGVSLGTVKSTNARALAKLRVSPDLVEPVRSTDPPIRTVVPTQPRES